MCVLPFGRIFVAGGATDQGQNFNAKAEMIVVESKPPSLSIPQLPVLSPQPVPPQSGHAVEYAVALEEWVKDNQSKLVTFDDSVQEQIAIHVESCREFQEKCSEQYVLVKPVGHIPHFERRSMLSHHCRSSRGFNAVYSSISLLTL